MRILVCGGRDYDDFEVLCNVLDYYQPDEIISGMARGADTLAVKFAERFGIPVLKFPADWDRYKKAAGFIRNKQMLVEGKPDLVIAFPGGKGTANMIKLAREANVEVIEIAGPNPEAPKEG